ncbi:MAG: hypothetical protein KBS98_06300 [Flavobacterium sp.]|nr:hypothetical protein [Candidatus Neoflavobacterium equi]
MKKIIYILALTFGFQVGAMAQELTKSQLEMAKLEKVIPLDANTKAVVAQILEKKESYIKSNTRSEQKIGADISRVLSETLTKEQYEKLQANSALFIEITRK